jgi:excisionase family DNA binding protein
MDSSDAMARDIASPPRFDDLPDLCTPEQARAFLQVGRNKIYELVKTGDLESVHFGRLVRIPKVALLHGRNGQKG